MKPQTTLKKVILSLTTLGFLTATPQIMADTSTTELTGDQKYACEALLCLSSGQRPSQCEPSIRKYFSIKYKKAWKTAQARKDFLKLCPTGDDKSVQEATQTAIKIESQNADLQSHINALSQIDGDCTLNSLNNNIETKYSHSLNLCYYKKSNLSHSNYRNKEILVCNDPEKIVKFYKSRISPNLNNNCQILMNAKFSDYPYEYNCDQKFYDSKQFANGYELVEISKSQYEALPAGQREIATKYEKFIPKKGAINPNNQSGFKESQGYFKRVPINKKCWIYKESK